MEVGVKMLVRILILSLLLAMLAGVVCAGEVAEGQVVKVANWVLTIRTASGESMAFSPRFVQERGSWGPARPAKTMLPALEAGETVRIEWTMDTRENRRRIDAIEVTSPLTRSSRGTVVSRSAIELVIHPREKEGTVTLNMRPVQVDGKWVPDPEISRLVQSLNVGDVITVTWVWDNEGRKRILAISDIEQGHREGDHDRR